MMRRERFKIRGAVLTLAVCLVLPMRAPAADVEPKLAIPLFLKIITYDESFSAQKPRDTLRMYFLYDFADSKSYQQFQEAQEYVQKAGMLMVSGVPVKLIGLQKPGADSALELVPDGAYAIVICGAGRGSDFKELAPQLRAKSVRSFAMDREDLASGVAVSVGVKDQKTGIVVSLRAAKAEGSRFSSRLLSMCTIVDRPS